MTTFELLNAINNFLGSSRNHVYLIQIVADLARIFDEHEMKVSKLTYTSNEKLAALKDEAQNYLAQELDVVRKNTRFKELFDAVGNLEANLFELGNWTFLENYNYFEELGQLVSQFSDAYETFLRDPRLVSVLPLLRFSKVLHCELNALTKTLLIISANLAGSTKLSQEREEILSLTLHPNDHLNVQVDKLQALVRIYEEVCRLLNVSTSEYPLRIIKVESGSLWAKLFGESQVIKLVTDLIRSGVQFLHRNYTQEGEIISSLRRCNW